MAHEQQQIPLEEIPRAVFDQVDQDGDGLISMQELANLLQLVGKQVPEDLDEMFEEADTNQDGKISYEEIPIIPGQA